METIAAVGNSVRDRAAAGAEGVTFLPCLAHSIRLRARTLVDLASRLANWAAFVEEQGELQPLPPFSSAIWPPAESEELDEEGAPRPGRRLL